MADYCDWPLWGPDGNLSEDALPLSDLLKVRIRAWLKAYDNAHDEDRLDWPEWQPPAGLSPDAQERAYIDEGEAIRTAIEQELGYAVDFKP